MLSRISQPTGVTVPFVEWHRCYGGNNDDVSNCVQLTPDGGFIVAGFTTSHEGDGWAITEQETEGTFLF